jgi:hypothetical protein
MPTQTSPLYYKTSLPLTLIQNEGTEVVPPLSRVRIILGWPLGNVIHCLMPYLSARTSDERGSTDWPLSVTVNSIR